MPTWIKRLSGELKLNPLHVTIVVELNELKIGQINTIVTDVLQFDVFELIVPNVCVTELRKRVVRIVVELGHNQVARRRRHINEERSLGKRAPFSVL